MLWDLYEVRTYRMLQPGHFLTLKSYLESERFIVKKSEEMNTTGYLIARRRGLNVNWKDYIEYKWTVIEGGGYRVSLRYFARWKALLSATAAVLTVGISAAVGAFSYKAAIMEAENFFANMWFRVEQHTLQPEERIVLEKTGFGNYEPQWTEEERRVMAAHGQVEGSGTAPGMATGMGAGVPATGMASGLPPAGVGAMPSAGGFPAGTGGFAAGAAPSGYGAPTTTGISGAPPGYGAAPISGVAGGPATKIIESEPIISGFGGEATTTGPQGMPVKTMKEGALLGEALNPPPASNIGQGTNPDRSLY